MNILVVGGSGLLGSHTVKEALRRGHSVTILARGLSVSEWGSTAEVKVVRGDISAMTEDELRLALTGQDAVVYALGLDDRQPLKKPAYERLHEDHVDVCLRTLRAAKASGAKKFVVFGSYFVFFDRTRPELRLADIHPYIRSRREQEDAVLGETKPGFDSFMLEIPYVIGSMPGHVPPWSFLFDMLAMKGKSVFFFGKGGTAFVTAGQIAQAALGAIERGVGGTAYPIGGVNMSWLSLAERFFAAKGQNKTLRNLPIFFFTLFGFLSAIILSLSGKERGLDIRRFAPFQYGETFLDPEPSMKALGYAHADYTAELSRMIREWESLGASR
jgi:dihydroflavonol-4-reductase